jgi:FlaA1/EpsC-like NDP-sugar epimerase
MSTYVLDASDLWGIIEKSCLGGSFGICLAVFLIISVFIWFNGYKVLEWYRHKPMSTKVVSIFFILAVLFSFGCISQDKDSQYYGGWFALPVSMAIGSTIVVGWSIVQRYRYRFTNKDNKSSLPELYRRQRNLVLLAKVMLWIWSCGWVLYFVAISVDKPPHVGAELLLRSAIASLGMFLMNIDSNIVDGIQEHDVLKGMIVCTFFSAVICTALLIMSLVLSRLMAYLHIKHLKIDNNRNHLYLFFGLNDASKLLANDILENDKNSVVVFIENSLVGEVMQMKIGLMDGRTLLIC